MIHLLVLSLILTGCGADNEIEVCTGGWFEFTCDGTHMEKCQTKDVKIHRGKDRKCTNVNEWEQDKNVFLYHDTGNKLIGVKITNLTSADSGCYKCKNKEKPTKVELELENDIVHLYLIDVKIPRGKDRKCTNVNEWEQDTNVFLYHDTGNKLGVKITNLTSADSGCYMCKNKRKPTKVELEVENDIVHLYLIDVKIPRGKDRKCTNVNEWEQDTNVFLYHDTGNKLREKITNLTSADSGCYMCKNKRKPTKVELEVKNDGCQEPLHQTVNATAKATVTCKYPEDRQGFFFCKEEGSECTPWSERRLTKIESGFSVSISDVSLQDGGVYWCGHKSANRSYRKSLRRIKLEVKIPEPPPATTPSSVHETTGSSTSSVQTTTPSTQPQGGSRLLVIVGIVAVMFAAELVLLVVMYKRGEGSKNTTENEDHNYAEIEERPQRPDSETAPKTLYVTANFPTNVSGSHYSNILFEKSSGEVSGDTYYTVGGSVPCPSYSTVNHPSIFTEKPPDSTVTSSQGP